MLAIVTTEPRWPSARAGWASSWVMTCLATRKVPVRLTSMIRDHSAAGSMCTGPPPATPAAWTSPSTDPPKESAACTSAATAASSVTSVRTKVQRVAPRVRAHLALGLGEVGSDHAAPLGQQAGRAGPPDARGGPRDDVGPSLEPSHSASRIVCARGSRADSDTCSSPGTSPGARPPGGAHVMKFALFYEIPVPRPWGDDSELVAYQNTLEQAIAGDRFGWHAFWTVEHHFLQEYSHCSNPEVLYGAIASRTERIRLGYGVRLMPKPYNHPVRTAESVAVLDLLSNGRVDLGTGRSATRAELEGFGIDPAETRRCGRRPSSTSSDAGPTTSTSSRVSSGRCPSAGCSPSPGRSRTRPSGARPPATRVTRRWATSGSGCVPSPSACHPRRSSARSTSTATRSPAAPDPIGAFVNNQAATFTMAICGPDRDKAISEARESFEWYPKTGARQIATLTDWMAERNEELGSYSYAADMKKTDDEGTLDLLSPGVPHGRQRLCARHAGRVPRGLPSVRGGRRRPSALPGQPVQDLARVGHADHRADGHRGHPGLRRLRTGDAAPGRIGQA